MSVFVSGPYYDGYGTTRTLNLNARALANLVAARGANGLPVDVSYHATYAAQLGISVDDFLAALTYLLTNTVIAEQVPLAAGVGGARADGSQPGNVWIADTYLAEYTRRAGLSTYLQRVYSAVNGTREDGLLIDPVAYKAAVSGTLDEIAEALDILENHLGYVVRVTKPPSTTDVYLVSCYAAFAPARGVGSGVAAATVV